MELYSQISALVPGLFKYPKDFGFRYPCTLVGQNIFGLTLNYSVADPDPELYCSYGSGFSKK